MASTDSTIQDDPRFDEAEAEVDNGEPWMFREQSTPNPLTIKALEWSTGTTRLGEAEFLKGVDREGKRWSILVGSVILMKRLIEGVVEEWDDGQKTFVIIRTEGRVQPGEVVSIKYLGDKKGAQYEYPNFSVSRKPAASATASTTPESKPPAEPVKAPEGAIDPQMKAAETAPMTADDIPF